MDPTSHVVDPTGRDIGCSTAVAAAPILAQVDTRFVTGLLEPFGVAFASDSRHLFVDSLFNPSAGAFNSTPYRDDSGVSLYSADDSALTPLRVGTFPSGSLVGMAVSPNGRTLVAANDSGASVFSVTRGGAAEVLAVILVAWILRQQRSGRHRSRCSADGDYVFVTLEWSDEMAVFNLKKAESNGFGSSDLVGYVPLGVAPVGMAISPNGRYLYATSEAATAVGGEGTLSTIDLRRAEHDPAGSVVSSVWAGCSPVRVAAAKSMVYVTARGSDDVIAFSATGLVATPESAMVGQVQVGESPVGLALVDHNRRIVIADSNRFTVGGATSNLAVVSTSQNGALSLLGYVGAGGFPRDMTVSRNGKSLVVSDFDSGDIEEVVVATLP